MALKIKQEDYDILEKHVQEQIKNLPSLDAYKQAGLSSKRYRFDLLFATGLKIGQKSAPGDLNLYDYINNDHIDSALKKITNTK